MFISDTILEIMQENFKQKKYGKEYSINIPDESESERFDIYVYFNKLDNGYEVDFCVEYFNWKDGYEGLFRNTLYDLDKPIHYDEDYPDELKMELDKIFKVIEISNKFLNLIFS